VDPPGCLSGGKTVPHEFMERADTTGPEPRLRKHVQTLAVEIGERHAFRTGSLQAASSYVEEQFRRHGLSVRSQEFAAGTSTVCNVETVIPGRDQALPRIVIGAHYDSVPGCAGANDNATGVAALLEIARAISTASPRRTLVLVAFVNEEPPFFRTSAMGSWVYARSLRKAGVSVEGMLSLETIGYYDPRPKSQRYPPPFGALYPDRGEFIGFVANVRSLSFARRCVKTFRRCSPFPSRWVAAPGWIPGLGWSDHWAFWQEGYAGIMVTDTAPFRYPWYHTAGDTPEKISFRDFSRVVDGLQQMVRRLCDADTVGE
jgi:Zn-dependent M28 family amino/carboxypeptidase